ncbi:hypothetical protein SDC9_171115 [bioreactor metagenome]|uniref:Uncharacterized protein n=1 Tax=bioreactor metagenome TaxID=1076179 RepID=A0A645GCK9_9ZZZZ
MSDQYRVQVGQATPGRAEVSGIDQDPLAGGFDEYAGMSEMGDLHVSTMAVPAQWLPEIAPLSGRE